jgi:RimJ/RimL family protein N-acetyltransferase
LERQGSGPWIGPLARTVWATIADLPSVQGPPALARAFAERWTGLGGPRGRPTMSLRIHALTEVQPVPAVPGRLRRATPADRAVVLPWLEAMHEEAIPHDPPIDPDWILRVRLAEAGDPYRALYLWVAPEGEPRSLCGASGPTRHGVRINAVYTPPAFRRLGYATAAVAELSRQLLASGRRLCILFTDLANPTSNRIYAAIGYRPVCDVDLIQFS